MNKTPFTAADIDGFRFILTVEEFHNLQAACKKAIENGELVELREGVVIYTSIEATKVNYLMPDGRFAYSFANDL